MRLSQALLAAVLLNICFASPAASDANAEFDAIYAEAKTRAAGQAVPEVFFQVAQQRAMAGASSFGNMGQLANYLADDFSLYSRVQGDVLREHCKAKGSDIAPYLSAIAAASSKDSTAASKIYARLGSNYDSIWSQLKPQAVKGLADLIENFAVTLKVPGTSLCEQLAKDPQRSAQLLSYSSARAPRSEVLRAISP